MLVLFDGISSVLGLRFEILRVNGQVSVHVMLARPSGVYPDSLLLTSTVNQVDAMVDPTRLDGHIDTRK